MAAPEQSRTETADGPGRPSVFERLAQVSYRRRWWALVGWVVVLVAVSLGSQAVGDAYRNDFSLPGTESQKALDLLQERAPSQAGTSVTIVVEAKDGVAGARARVESMLAEVGGKPHVVGVVSPFDDAGAVSKDGTIAYATVALDKQAEDIPVDDTRAIIDTAQQADGDGLRVELAGDAVRTAQEQEGGAAEGIGIMAALVILVLLFGSLFAAVLPVAIALFAVGTTLGLIILASRVATIADFTAPLMMLVGLGVGIDYALLVFSRFRGELAAGQGREPATVKAIDTAGRTVFFAGCTVIVALLGLVVLGLGSLQGVAVAVALTVLLTMVASLTLLPALLGLFGARIEKQVRRRTAKKPAGDRWSRWTGAVQRRAWVAALVPTALLAALSLPALDMRLGFADAGTDSPSTTSRQAYDLLGKGFGPGFNGPLIVVAEGDATAAGRARTTLAQTEGVAAALPPQSSGDGLSTIIVFPDSAPQAAATSGLVDRLRDDVLPSLARETDARFLVGGSTAATEDFSTAVADRLPAFVALVVGLSMLLLLLVFRSLLIPLKAAVLNLLSVGVAMGVMTLVFQNGALGAEKGPIEAYVPVMIFAIVFGLSMDYEVFLLSRMHEEWERGKDAAQAVRHGLATTGQVVTAAAAIMIVVFGAFMFSGNRMLTQFGFGLAVAVFVDAVVIRCLILPAVMQLLGRRAWWLPERLARVLPRVAIEHD
ncbi:MMPL family transporter [Streptomyces niveiscabiei]|uniref:MMPL family transporter n=1 Tax=Streptomyces niveiscabiei TaxID=164115 RepID=UPI0029B58858|nr:MMPL family transporter [Streptomyces niveiscabiei]MDX3385297.1 MMPL family transporter [Streptomyces niveiscabiei]